MTQAAAAKPLIELKDVEKSFGENRVLQGLSFSVNRGESFALIGGSGVGKSVAMKCLLGLVKPDKGEILVDGKAVGEPGNDLYSRVGMLFQEGALFDSLTVWQNVAFRLLRGPRKLPPKSAKSIAVEKLKRVGLAAETADLYPSELSGGMKKRAGLARAIAADPELLLFDEPTTGLDPIRAAIINELIHGIVTETGATAIAITHDMDSVRKIASRAGLLYNGKLIWSGASDGLSTSDNDHLRQFVNGSPRGPMQVSF